MILIDIWSIGCIFAELIMGNGLFKGEEKKADRNNRNPFQSNQLDKIFNHLGVPNESKFNPFSFFFLFFFFSRSFPSIQIN